MSTHVAPGKHIEVTAPSGGVTRGTPVLIATLFGLPSITAAEGELVNLETEEVHELPKTAGLAIAQGEAVYWNSGTGKVTKTATDRAIGQAYAASGVSDTTVQVKLLPAAALASPDAQGAVMEADYNAQTVLVAVADNTPLPVTIGEGKVLGRDAGGDVAAIDIEPQHLAVLASQIGVPFLIEANAEAASAAINVFNADCPHKLQVIDAFVRCTGANAGGTLKLNNGALGAGTDITDAMTMAVNKALGRATTLDPAAATIAEGGSLSMVKNDVGDDGIAYIWAVRVA